jgi:hypothetical protein
MMAKAAAAGLSFDPETLKLYTMPLDPALALDKFHESWKLLNGFPRRRSIDKDALISNSVLIRCNEEATWRPQNLDFEKGLLASSYKMVGVVGDPTAVAVEPTQSAGAGKTAGASGGD